LAESRVAHSCDPAFVVHPTGREVWYYSLFWFIPALCYTVRERSVVFRSLEAVFSAQASGRTYNSTLQPDKKFWIVLVPKVIAEPMTPALKLSLACVFSPKLGKFHNHSLGKLLANPDDEIYKG
jgi:hypothetical protein